MSSDRGVLRKLSLHGLVTKISALGLVCLCSRFNRSESRIGNEMSLDKYSDRNIRSLTNEQKFNFSGARFTRDIQDIDFSDLSLLLHHNLEKTEEAELSIDEEASTDTDIGIKTVIDNPFEMTSRIINGMASQNGEHPYMASIITTTEHRGKTVEGCGGTLVAPSVVLCAAHCVANGNAKYVRLGLFYTKTYYNTEVVKIAEVKTCPTWNSKNFNCDVALIRLEMASTRPPIMISFVNEFQSNPALTVMGWGVTSDGGNQATQLMEANVYPMDQNLCKNRYGDALTDTMFCTAINGKDACQGDSGGPIIIKATSNSPARQVGVVSWGKGCADNYYPGVYSRLHISGVVTFINYYICLWSPVSCTQGQITNSYRVAASGQVQNQNQQQNNNYQYNKYQNNKYQTNAGNQGQYQYYSSNQGQYQSNNSNQGQYYSNNGNQNQYNNAQTYYRPIKKKKKQY